MGIYGALQTAVSGLRAQSHAMENISGNIANSQTTGYKRVETSFVDLIPDAPVKSQVPGAVTSYSRSTANVRGDVQNADTETYMALNGDGFFVVEPATGDTSGTYYTRRGDFDLDKNGYLVNGAGFKLKGVEMQDGAIIGSVPNAIKIDNSFLPAKRSSTIDYQLNLPQLPKNGAYVGTTPGSELMKTWNYGNASPTPVIASTTGAALPANVPSHAVGTTLDATLLGTAPASSILTTGDTLTVDVNGTPVTYTFKSAGPFAANEIDMSGDINSVLTSLQGELTADFAGSGAVVQIKGGKIDLALGNANANPLTVSSVSAGTGFGLDGAYTALAAPAINGSNTPASMMVSNGQTLTVNIGGTTRTYKFDTNNTVTPAAGEVEINASGSVDSMLAAIQADLRLNGGTGAAAADVKLVGSSITVAINGNYTQNVTIGGTANILGANATYTPVAGAVTGILAGDVDQFMKESISGGGITVYSKTGEPINMQMRWAKTSNETGNETWSMFYASDSRPGATQPWTKVADYSFDQGILQSVTPVTGVSTNVGTEQVVFDDLTVNGTHLGEISINHGLKGMTQFADNGGTTTTTALKQNGYGAGEFISVGISDQGRVVASYSNGETREVAQIVVASFNAPNQLKRGDGGTYTATSQSGEAILSQTGDGIVGSSLEASNTDISEEFSKLIVTQQAYSANTRIVSAANDMLKETLSMIR
jgi:flagellar hook protein FlgE